MFKIVVIACSQAARQCDILGYQRYSKGAQQEEAITYLADAGIAPSIATSKSLVRQFNLLSFNNALLLSSKLDQESLVDV